MLRGRGGGIAAYRLDDKFLPLLPRFKKELLDDLGRPYDFSYDMTDDRVALLF